MCVCVCNYVIVLAAVALVLVWCVWLVPGCSAEGGQVLLFCDGAEYYGNSSYGYTLTTEETIAVMTRNLPRMRKSVSVTYLGLGSDAHLPWMGRIAAVLGGSLVRMCACVSAYVCVFVLWSLGPRG